MWINLFLEIGDTPVLMKILPLAFQMAPGMHTALSLILWFLQMSIEIFTSLDDYVSLTIAMYGLVPSHS